MTLNKTIHTRGGHTKPYQAQKPRSVKISNLNLSGWHHLGDEFKKPDGTAIAPYYFNPIAFIDYINTLNRDLELQVGLFFDGTGQDKSDTDSLSNIARLSDVYPEESSEVEIKYRYKDVMHGKYYVLLEKGT